MTAFYWVETKAQAQADAAYKGVSSWVWFGSKEEMSGKNPLDFDAVYMRTGIMELEREFARIMREDARKRWLC